MITAQPFRPFRVGLVGGRSFTVKHPENAAAAIDGREMTIYDDEGAHYVEMLIVDVIEPVTAPAQNRPDGNGA